MSGSVDPGIVQVIGRDRNGLGVISNGYIFTAAHCVDVDFRGSVAIGGHPLQMCKRWDGEEFLADFLFVDAVSDLAVLCRPDSQDAYEEAETYDQAVTGRGLDLYFGTLPSIADQPEEVRIRNRNGWVDGKVINSGRGTMCVVASEQIYAGASGGPVIIRTSNELVAINSSYSRNGRECSGLQPVISQAMPVWFGREFRADN